MRHNTRALYFLFDGHTKEYGPGIGAQGAGPSEKHAAAHCVLDGLTQVNCRNM
jgi:hypothetical protein